MAQESKRDGQERQQEEDGEQVLRAPGSRQLYDVEQQDGGGNDGGLSNFHAVDASQNVDGVGAEHGQHAHVDIVQQTLGETEQEGE